MGEEALANLVIAGGGTGGHVLAGIAVADVWRAKMGEGAEVVFVGAEGGIEEKLVPRAGYRLETLKVGSLNRVGIGRKIKTLMQLPGSVVKSAAVLLSLRPAAVLGVGGYASGPLVLTARLLGKLRCLRAKTAILEQNAVPGFTNRVLGRWVHRVFSAFPLYGPHFEKRKVKITGNPIRSSMRPTPSARRDPFTIFVFGGSQGAQGINSLVLDSLAHLQEFKERLRWIHQTGEKDFERVSQKHRELQSHAQVEKFIDDMATAYSEASLLICRAGSSTLAEIAAVGRAAILIPFPFASDNHQEKNAEVFSGAGAARILVQGHSNGKDLADLIREMVLEPQKITEMEKKAARLYKPNAAQDLVEDLLGEGDSQ